ncbi:DUF4878 domain-containing protein [Cytobacillus oceanisediminis]|uniref:DUF4878 domain-containing protein n=1 Tax=Cytobacillus oceanisediminis TaxID=665099 RepID=UPI0020796ADC|nr:DUF4878 domain-containing protein [Cytobacillus oceanisediminis]USK42243.1 DUF4878 domain-containing protein [Cytobacillus oceanisediminis]
MYAGSFGDFIKDYQDKYKIIQPINEKIKGNTATVKVDDTYRDNSSETKEFILLNEEGKWKIAELGSVLK